MTMIGVICAIGSGVGMVGCFIAIRRGDSVTGTGSAAEGTRTLPFEQPKPSKRRNSKSSVVLRHSRLAKAGLPALSALVVEVVTHWPVAAAIAAAASVMLPSALRSTSAREATRRTEAIAVWTELLRDTLTASAGLAQAIVATASLAPDEIEIPVAHLANRITSGVPMDEALRVFAGELDHPSGSEVVCALRLVATSRAQRLVDLLGALAESTRADVSMRLRVEASRASARSGVRTIIWFSLGFVVLLTIVARSYLAPFGSAAGQGVLILVGLCYAAGLTLMVRLVCSPVSTGQGALRT